MKSLLCVLTSKDVATDGGSCWHSDPTLGRLEALLSKFDLLSSAPVLAIIFICGGESRFMNTLAKVET